jgi:G3E family GTPase
MSIPVLILSGFLGSGKTTLLLELLAEARSRGLKPGILMNELGKMDVDGEIIGGASQVSVAKLLDGCVCCSKKSELSASLQELLSQKPDVLFVELTGVANPEEVVDALTEPALLGRVILKQIVTVLDAEYTLEYNSIFASDKDLVRTLRRQMEVADLILINKTDLVDGHTLQKIEKTVRKHNPFAPLLYTQRSKLDLDILLRGIEPVPEGTPQARQPFRVVKGVAAGARMKEPDTSEHAPHRHQASFSRIRTFTLQPPTDYAIPPAKLEQFLGQWGNRLLRAKGYLAQPGHAARRLLQFAGKRITYSSSTYQGEPYLVLIGMDLEESELMMEWAELLPGTELPTGRKR